jgi:hypothetical protein
MINVLKATAFRCVSVVCNLLKSLCVPVVAFRCVSVRAGSSQTIEIINALGCVPVRFGPPTFLPPLWGGIETTPRRADALVAKSLCDRDRAARRAG